MGFGFGFLGRGSLRLGFGGSVSDGLVDWRRRSDVDGGGGAGAEDGFLVIVVVGCPVDLGRSGGDGLGGGTSILDCQRSGHVVDRGLLLMP